MAERAGAPIIPVGLHGTAALFPIHGRPRRAPVEVWIGAPVDGIDAAHDAVAGLAGAPIERRPIVDSRLRRAVGRLAQSRTGAWVVAVWAFAEAMAWPLLPEFALAVLCVAAPRRAPRLAAIAAVASVAGGVVTYLLAARGIALPAPLTTPRMHATTAHEFAVEGAWAVAHQPLSGIPFKVYAAAAGHEHVGLLAFVGASIPARALRILAVGVIAGLSGAATHRLRRFYPAYLVVFITLFAGALTGVVLSWSGP